ncbi:MAG: LamG-like jellyroll fold domain-containing protein, partial [Verrucomicrobiota bacterium]|nr:LamG-like jellyroll fold domain-containing protein [Verrucomicrobiota bacterium]
QRAPNGGGTFIFGARNNGDVPYNGYVDDVTIWREVLPEATIKALADGASPIGATQEDEDGDGLPDSWEEKYGVDDPEGDDDNDGLTNIEELEARTKPNKADSDEDGLNDKQELVDTKTNPLSPDTDRDGLLDGVETNTGVFISVNNTGTDPSNEDTDGDGYSDARESIGSLSDPNDPNSIPLKPEIKLLAYWDFNDPSDPKSAADVSGNAPAADFTGPAKYSDDSGGFSGAAGDYSLDLGGVNDQSAAVTPEGTHLDESSETNEMSVAFWQNTTQVGNTSAFWINAPAATGSQRGFQAHTPWGNGTIYFDQSGCCGATQRLTIGGQVVTNQWQHFVFQRDEDGNMEIWVDGELKAEQGGAEPLDPFNGIITIGAMFNGGGSMAARIDEFAIYNRPLDGAEIQALYGGILAIDLITPPALFTITDVERDEDGQVTFTFNARPNVIYAVDVSEDCELWQELDDNVVGTKGKATFIDISGLGEQKSLFYRVRTID